jgi:hypothetical protein
LSAQIQIFFSTKSVCFIKKRGEIRLCEPLATLSRMGKKVLKPIPLLGDNNLNTTK